MVYFIILEIHGFSHQFLIAWEKAGKPIKWEKQSMRKWSEIHGIGRVWEIETRIFQNVRVNFFNQFFILRYTMGNASLFPSIFNSTGKYSKIYSVSSQVVFPQYDCVPKSGDSLKEQKEKINKVNSFFKKIKFNSRDAGIQRKLYQKKKRA